MRARHWCSTRASCRGADLIGLAEAVRYVDEETWYSLLPSADDRTNQPTAQSFAPVAGPVELASGPGWVAYAQVVRRPGTDDATGALRVDRSERPLHRPWVRPGSRRRHGSPPPRRRAHSPRKGARRGRRSSVPDRIRRIHRYRPRRRRTGVSGQGSRRLPSRHRRRDLDGHPRFSQPARCNRSKVWTRLR